jgi:hypothetical protein
MVKHSDDDVQAELDSMLRGQRVYRRRSAIAGLSIFLLLAFGIAVSAYFKEFWFRPTPDMEEVERISYALTNDPVCRELVTIVDGLQKRWKTDRRELRTLILSEDPAAIQAGRRRLEDYIDAYKIETRRVTIMKGQWPHIRDDVQRFLRHVIFYLDRMNAALERRQLSLADGKIEAIPDARDPVKEAIDAKSDKLSAEDYERFWSHVTEDHDKWRTYRQGPIPCGMRVGEVPPLPPATDTVPTTPEEDPVPLE